MPRSIALATRSLTAVGALLLAACASSRGRYVWADSYANAATPAAAAGAYVVGAGDVLAVSVWGSDKLSTRSRVRADGCISVPLLNDVAAAGRTPAQLAADIEARLKRADVVLAPRVTVLVEEVRPVAVAVLGAVTRAGTYPLDAGSGVAEALAAAGGLTEFAHRDRIYVLRRSPEPVRIRFTFGRLTSAASPASAFRLRAGDVVVAE